MIRGPDTGLILDSREADRARQYFTVTRGGPRAKGLPVGCPVAEKRRQFGAESITSRRRVCAVRDAEKPRNLNGKTLDSGWRAEGGARRRLSVVERAPGRGGA
jgi:hypothetical protein